MTTAAKRAGALFAGWLLHDIEEAFAFPSTTAMLAQRTGIRSLAMNHRQSVVSIGLVGMLVGVSCWRGARTGGESRLFRAVTAGLEGHVFTHVAASVATRGYTAGVVTAPTIMLPAARFARGGVPASTRSTVEGAVLLVGAAACAHVIARKLVR